METPTGQERQLTYAEYQTAQEETNLRSLAIGCIAYGCFQVAMLILQIFMMRQMMTFFLHPGSFGGREATPQPPAAFLSMMQAFMICSYVLIGISALLSFAAAKCIFDRRNWIIPMIAGGFACINVPIGTVLGVFIFILLSKPNIRARFTS